MLSRPGKRRLLAALSFSAALAATPLALAAEPDSQGRSPGSNARAFELSGPDDVHPDQGLRPLDVRDQLARGNAVAPALSGAEARLRASLGEQGTLEIDPVTGTPRIVARLDGFLTGPSDASPEQVALDYVRAHADAFGLDSADLESLRLTRDYTDIEGTTHLSWAQVVDGVEVFENGLIANVAENGRLLNVMGSPVAGIEREAPAADPALSAKAALGEALADVDAPGGVPAVERQRGAELHTSFAGPDEAELVLFPTGPGETRLAWRVEANATSTEIYDSVVDAKTGEVLFRENTVDFSSFRVWQYAPNIHQVCPGCLQPGSGQQADLGQYLHWNTASNTLNGNFAHVYTDVDDNNAPDSPFANCPECGEIAPNVGSGASAGWHYSFVANPRSANGQSSFNCFSIFPWCSWTITGNLNNPNSTTQGFGWRDNLRQNGTQVYWYVNNFHDWLNAAPFGFTNAAGNFEGVDEVKAEVLDGANTDFSAGSIPGTPDVQHINNANMSTPADGTPPRMQMYLFAELGGGSTPEANGGDDASVMYHEYAHGLSNRLVLDAGGSPSLRSFQASSMGEGWSDWYALDYLEGQDIDETDTADNGQMNMAVYLMGGDIHALRTEGLDCSVGSSDADCPGGNTPHTGGYTLADMGDVIAGGPEVHADGEIWAQTLWDLRQRFVGDLGGGTAVGGAGITQVRSVITRGMELSPPDPSFLDMRNAILQADVADGGNDNQDRIWSVFANRGMGFFAEDDGSSDTNPTANFQTPPSCPAQCVTLSGVVTERSTGAPLANARVTVDPPGSLTATTNASGQYSLQVPANHTYDVTASKLGHNPVVRRNLSIGGVNATLNLAAYRDWSAIEGGATLGAFSPPNFTGNGCGPRHAFDISLGSVWGSSSTNPQDPSLPGGAKSAVINLPRTVNVKTFAVDPGAGCGDDDSASTRSLRIQTKQPGAPFRTVTTRSYTNANNHRLNNFSLAASVASNLKNRITAIRVTMLDNQGGITPGQAHRDFMDLAEVQVYGKPAN